MSDLFILGAGFSKAISNEMPVTKELALEVIASYRHKNDIPPFVKNLLEEDFEKALTFLIQDKPWLPESENLRHRALYLDLTNVIRYIFREKSRDPIVFGTNQSPKWLEYLIYHWHQNRCAVITLNYDTLIERVASVASWKNPRGIPTGELYPIALTKSLSRNRIILSGDPIETFKLFKLHGSINWFYSGRSDFYGENLYYVPCVGGVDEVFTAALGADQEKRDWDCMHDKSTLIIPPTLDKSAFFEHESFRNLWYQAASSVKEATRIICMGYSLPGSDLTMAQFLKSSAPDSRIPFDIVDLTPDRVGHFAGALGQNVYDFKQELSGVNCIPRYVAQNIAQDKDDKFHILRDLPRLT